MKTVSLEVINGLGDKSLDILGSAVICKYLKCSLKVKMDDSTYWGKYDKALFNYSGFEISEESCDYYIKQEFPSTSLCPYKLYEFLKNHFPDITYKQVSDDFLKTAKEIIKPSDIIKSRYPEGIEKAYGIHLRKSDKVSNMIIHDGHMTTIPDFDDMLFGLLEDINKIIQSEENPSFFICSEDKEWAESIKATVKGLTSKPIKFIEPDYTNKENYANFVSVLDMFCLSRCKRIYQGVRYTTFSLLAALLGNNKIINYSHLLTNYNICLIHNWISVLHINDDPKNYDTDYFFCKSMKSPHADFKTNIAF